jgi:hypothetical protein
MTHVQTRRAPDVTPGARPATNQRTITVAVASAYVLAVAFRVALTATRTGPLVVGDEIGYLAHARVLAGGTPIDLSTATYYYSGSSLFLVPAFWFTDNPETAYQVALVIQALISAAAVPLLYGLCRDLGSTWRASLGAAAVGSFAVDAVFWSGYVLSESLLAVLTIAWVWLTVRIVRDGRSRSGMTAAVLLGVVFGLMAGSHSRGALLVAIGAAVGMAVIRWAGWRNVVACAVVGAVAVAGAFWLNVATMHANFPGRPASGLVPANRGTAGSGVTLVDQLVSTLGQVWYVAVATGLIALFGLLHAWYLAISTKSAPRIVAAALATLALAALTFGSATVLLVSAPTLSPDFLVYGRYVSSCIPLLTAWGIVGLLHHAGRVLWALQAATLVVSVALAAVVRSATSDVDPTLAPRPFPIPAVHALARIVADGDTAHLHELRVTAAAMVLFALCCALAAIPHRAARAALVAVPSLAFAALTITTVTTVTDSSDDVTYPEGAALNISQVTEAETMAWDTTIAGGAGPNIVTRMGLGYWADDAELVPFDSSATRPEAGVDAVAATQTWDGTRYGYTLVGFIPARDIAIWEPAS